MTVSHKLRDMGFSVLRGAVDATEVAAMRKIVGDNLHRMANTRPNPASRHIAGFHRVPALEPLHHAITSNGRLNEALTAAYAPHDFITIGLSDITVNRSQPWHTDLLRGKYARYLTPEICWDGSMTGCLKALLYLQDGKSLKVVPGSHRRPVSLADDHAAIPQKPGDVLPVEVKVGDIVLMDIRLVHRGSTEEEMLGTELVDAPKILVSTVYGAQGVELTRAMQLGNMQRMIDWETTHLSGN